MTASWALSLALPPDDVVSETPYTVGLDGLLGRCISQVSIISALVRLRHVWLRGHGEAPEAGWAAPGARNKEHMWMEPSHGFPNNRTQASLALWLRLLCAHVLR